MAPSVPSTLPDLPSEILARIYVYKGQHEAAMVFQKYNRGRGDRLAYRYNNYLARNSDRRDIWQHTTRLRSNGMATILGVYTPGERFASFREFIVHIRRSMRAFMREGLWFVMPEN